MKAEAAGERMSAGETIGGESARCSLSSSPVAPERSSSTHLAERMRGQLCAKIEELLLKEAKQGDACDTSRRRLLGRIDTPACLLEFKSSYDLLIRDREREIEKRHRCSSVHHMPCGAVMLWNAPRCLCSKLTPAPPFAPDHVSPGGSQRGSSKTSYEPSSTQRTARSPLC